MAMTKRLALIAIVALFAFAASETLDTVDDSHTMHQEAKDTISSLLQTGKKDSACRKLASGTISELKSSIKNTNKLISKMDVGKNCHTAGLSAYNAAKARTNNLKNDWTKKNKKCNSAKNAKVTITKPISSFKDCSALQNDSKVKAANKAIKDKCDASNKAKSAYNESKKALKLALKAHQDSKHKCACKAQSTHKAAVKAAGKVNTGANKKAWTKAYHMICVLDGKSASKCKVPSIPRAKASQRRRSSGSSGQRTNVTASARTTMLMGERFGSGPATKVVHRAGRSGRLAPTRI